MLIGSLIYSSRAANNPALLESFIVPNRTKVLYHCRRRQLIFFELERNYDITRFATHLLQAVSLHRRRIVYANVSTSVDSGAAIVARGPIACSAGPVTGDDDNND